MSNQKAKFESDNNDEAIVSKALLNAARRLGIKNVELAEIIGISKTKVTNIDNEKTVVRKSGKEFDLALLFIRMYRSLDSITGGDDRVASSWIRNNNKALKAVPLERMKSLEGLVDVLHYLDSRRAIT